MGYENWCNEGQVHSFTCNQKNTSVSTCVLYLLKSLKYTFNTYDAVFHSKMVVTSVQIYCGDISTQTQVHKVYCISQNGWDSLTLLSMFIVYIISHMMPIISYKLI